MSEPARFIVVTGLSGAGKTQTLRFLDDLGYNCVDNLPAVLVPKFAELVAGSEHPRNRMVVCVDARSGKDLMRLPGYLDEVEALGLHADTLFLDTTDTVLIHRYSESRRRHPCAPGASIEEGIRLEREFLDPIRARADLVVDTSAISTAELREQIASIFLASKGKQPIIITVLSFGFKYGIPQEADLVIDVRFLPNPYYDDELRPLTGDDPTVRDFVLDNDHAREYLAQQQALLKFLIPRYAAIPKSYLTIAVGCTGGVHRSVAVAGALGLFLRELSFEPRIRHRDIAKDE